MTAPCRVQISRAKGWRKPEGAVVVARPGKFGNPWRVGEPATFWLPHFSLQDMPIGLALDAADAVALYDRLLRRGPNPVNRLLPTHLTAEGRRWVRDGLRAHAAKILAELPVLRGRDLCCWCPLDAPCHADVLLELAAR